MNIDSNTVFDNEFARKMKGEIYSLISDEGSVDLDLSKTERSGFACIQLIIAFFFDRNLKDKALKVTLSSSLKDMTRDLGLEKIFNEMEQK